MINVAIVVIVLWAGGAGAAGAEVRFEPDSPGLTGAQCLTGADGRCTLELQAPADQAVLGGRLSVQVDGRPAGQMELMWRGGTGQIGPVEVRLDDAGQVLPPFGVEPTLTPPPLPTAAGPGPTAPPAATHPPAPALEGTAGAAPAPDPPRPTVPPGATADPQQPTATPAPPSNGTPSAGGGVSGWVWLGLALMLAALALAVYQLRTTTGDKHK